MSAAIRSLDELDSDLVPMEPEATELAPALEDSPLSVRLEDLDPTVDVDAEMRQRLIADDGLDSDAFNQARLEGPPGVNPIAIADRPDLYSKPPLAEAEQVLRDRPRMRDAVMKDRDLSRGVAVTRWPNWARAWDSIASHVPEIAGASKDQVEITTRQYRRGANSTAELFGALYGEPVNRERRRSMDDDAAEMAELQKSLEGLPRALQWIPGGLGQAPNIAAGMGARALGLALGAAPAAIPVVGPGIAAVTAPALATGLPVAWTGMVEGGNWHADYIAANPDADRKTAAVGGLIIGLVNGSLELLPIDVGLDTLTGNAKREMVKLMADREFRDVLAFAAKRWAMGVGAEGITEALQQIGPTLFNNVKRYADGEITAGELIKTIASEALEAGLVGAEYSILPGGGNVAIASAGAQAQVERAKGVRERFAKIAETSVENAEIIQSAPDKYQKLIDEAAQDGSGIDSVYVSVAELEAAYEGAAPAWQNLNQKVEGLPERLAEAKATNGKVRFSIGEFSTWVAGAEQFDRLGDHLSFRETQPSLEEARKLGSPEVMQSVIDAMNAFRSSSEVDPVALRENEAAFATNMEALFAEKLPAVGLRVRQKAALLFARSISRISEMSGQDPLEYMASVLDRVELEQRPELDSPGEQARSSAFGTERFQASNPNVRAAAIRVGGQVFEGAIHDEANNRMLESLVGDREHRWVGFGTDDVRLIVTENGVDTDLGAFSDGFVMQDGRFLSQAEAVAELGISESEAESGNLSGNGDVGFILGNPDTFKQTVEKIQSQREAILNAPEQTNPFPIPDGHVDRLRKKAKRAAKEKGYREAQGQPKNERRQLQLKDGTKISVGRITPQDWVERVNSLNLTPEEISAYRNWYYEVYDTFAQIFGEQAPLFAAAWLMAQQNASPAMALQNSLRVREQVISGTIADPNRKLGGLADDRLVPFWQEVLDKGLEGLSIEAGSQKLNDFVDSALGRATRTWMNNDPAGGEPAVADVHTIRDVGWIDEAMMTRLKAMVADSAQMDGVIEDMKGAPSEAQYELAAEFLHEIRDYLNENEIFGGGFERVAEVQALGWMAMLIQMGQPAQTVDTAIEASTNRISTELSFGEGAPYVARFPELETLPLDEKITVTDNVVSAALAAVIDDLGGAPLVSHNSGISAWVNNLAASSQVTFLATKESAAKIAKALGYLLQQTEVWSGGELEMTKGGNLPAAATHWFVDIAAPELTDRAKQQELWSAVLEETGQDLGFSPVDTEDGTALRIYLPLRGQDGARLKWGSSNAEKAQAELMKTIMTPLERAAKRMDFRVTASYIPGAIQIARNDWTENPDGRVHLEGLTETQQGKLRAARPAVEAAIKAGIERARARSGSAAGAQAGGVEIFEQPAYHGTPSIFDRFDITKIGTGEGNQAFGWGLYFSSLKKIADFYREALTPGPNVQFREASFQTGLRSGLNTINGVMDATGLDFVHAEALLRVIDNDGSVSDARDNLDSAIERASTPESKASITATRDALDEIASEITVSSRPGQVLEVDLPDDENLLDWRAELRAQHPAVREKLWPVLKRYGIDYEALAKGWTGQLLYAWLASKMGTGKGDQGASEALLEAGILGHKYPAGELSGKKSEATNFVIYDDKAIAIVTKFQAGKAGATAGQLVVDRAFKRFLLQLSEGRVNDSTLVHELAHLTLELVLDMAEQDGAADDIREYAGQALAFLGVENRGQIQGKHHERWAESWELYLREGKAPSADLAGAFAFFRSRLLKIYETLRGRLMEADHDLAFVPLFDRLLATEDEIRSAKSRTDLMTAFADRAAVAGLEDSERDEVVALLREAQGEERKKLERIIAREQARVLKEQRGELREKVAEEVYARPEQKLRHWLVKGVLPGGEFLPTLSTGKLSRADVEAIGGDVAKLPRGTWTREGGWDPASVAAAFGYSSPEEMLDALERSERPQDIISRRVQEEAERLGLVATADELEAMAAESLAGPQRDRLYELERRIAARLRRADTATRTAEERAIAGQAAPKSSDVRTRVTAAQAALDEAVARQADQAELDLLQVDLKRAQDAVEVARVARRDQGEAADQAKGVLEKIPAKERTALYRAAAQRIVDGVQVKDLKRELRSWVHRRAQAAKAKVSAQMKRDWAAFDKAIEAEQVANALVEIGSAQVMESKKQRRALSELKKPGSRTRARLAKYSWEVDAAGNRTNLLDLIDEMLAQVNFSEVSNRRLAYAVDIERFAQTLAAERGIDLPLPSWVLDLKEAPSYKTMKTAELGELYRTVKALEKHGLQLAREAEGALAADEKDLLDEGRAALDERMPSIAAIRANFEKDEGDQRKSKRARFVASMMSLPTIATYLDNMNPEGFFTRTFIHPMREAAQVENRLKKSTAKLVNAAWDRYSPLEKRQFYTHRIRIDSIGQSLTKNAILSIAAQQGNEHNRAALRDGKPYGFTDGQLREILSHVTDKDADFLIAVAEAIDSLWPEASAAQKRMNGEIAPKVTGEPWQLPSGKWMPGFYFPLRWNTELHDRAQQYEDREKGLDAFSFHSGAVMTKPGAMNARKKTSGALTVSSDFMGTVTGHLDDMTKAIAWQETLVKLDRLAKKLAPELKRVAGNELYRQFRETFIRVAQSDRGVRNVGWLNNAVGQARGGLSLIAMGWRLTSAAIQVTGALPAIHRVGAANVAAGYAKLYHNPLGTSGAIAALRAEIPALIDRAEKFDRDAQQSMLRLNPVDAKHPIKSLKPIRSIASHYGFYLLGMIDTFTASAVGAAAMRQALNGEVVGIKAGDRTAAARYADGIVRSTQGSGETMDLPAIMDGDQLQKMMTTMMTYTNAQMQQAVLAGALTYEQRREDKDAKARGVPVVPHNRPKFLAFMAFTYLVAPVLEETIRAMINTASGDPPDEDEWLAKLMLKIGFGPVGGVPIARDMYSYASGYGAGETPFATTFEIYGKTLETTYEMFTDDFDGEKMLRAWAAFGTYITGAPTKAMVDAAEMIMQEPIGRERR